MSCFPFLYWYVDVETLYSLNRTCREAWAAYRALDIKSYARRFPSPRERLRVFANYYAALPAPGSAQWLASRSYVGGSEMSTWMGLNPYQTCEQLIRRKRGIERFLGNEATNWGNIFEPVLFEIVSARLGARLLELGSIPGLYADGEVVQSYTPDRVGVISQAALRRHVPRFVPTPGLEEREELVVLFEAKCPFRRVPNDRVPEYYLPQPLLGACTISITEACVFADGMFRQCPRAELNFNTCHSRGREARPPEAIGCVLFFAETPLAAEPVDLGLAGAPQFRTILHRAVREHQLRVVYPRVCARGEDVNAWLAEVTALGQPYAILPWKLFKLSLVHVPIQPDFLERHTALLLEARRRIKEYVNPDTQFTRD